MKDNEVIEAFWISQGGKPHPKEDLWFYESDRNMLMLVVEKISELEYLLPDFDESFPRENIFRLGIMAPIDVVYSAVLEFISWYNQQKKV